MSYIDSYTCANCHRGHDTSTSDLDFRFCGSCRKYLIEKKEVYSLEEYKEKLSTLTISEMDINNRISELKFALEINKNLEEQQMTVFKKVLSWLGFNMCPKVLQNERHELNKECKKLDSDLNKVQRDLHFVNSIFKRNIIPAQIRYQQKQLLIAQKKEVLKQKRSGVFIEVINKIEQKREDYLIRNKDYKRGNPLENYINKAWKEKVLFFYTNKCVTCQSEDNFTLDHFWLPKNEGGNFVMLHLESRSLVSNVIPLCRSCNSSKCDKPFQNFFTINQLDYINNIQFEVSKQLMMDPQLCEVASRWYGRKIHANKLKDITPQQF